MYLDTTKTKHNHHPLFKIQSLNLFSRGFAADENSGRLTSNAINYAGQKNDTV